MFNSNFYPTPQNVIEAMVADIDLYGKNVLEPSAGRGDIVDYAKKHGANVIACELNSDLAMIVASKCRLIGKDFLQVTAEEVSHINLVLMNPPFDADERHILHAYDIAPEGCRIVALSNTQTLKNSYTKSRDKLNKLIKDFGYSQDLGSAFSNADRQTDVQVSMINIFKPRTTEDTEFEGFFDMNDTGEEDAESGIMPFNEIRDIVNRYVGAVKVFNKVEEANKEISNLINPINASSRVQFGAFHADTRHGQLSPINRDEFKKELQKSAWRTVFNRLNMDKYITSKIKQDLNSFIEKQSNVPFTMGNIHRMLQLLVGTHADRMNQVLVQAFERICSFADSNNTAGEGWKTNSSYKVNRRFIHPYICEYDSRWPKQYVDVKYERGDTMDDIVKALCLLTGESFDNHIPLRNFFHSPYHLRRDSDGKLMGGCKYLFTDLQGWNGAESMQASLAKKGIKVTIEKTEREWGKWHDWGFFRVRGYMKGTMHFEFKDEKVWELFNRKVAEIKGWRLPEQTDNKKKGNERTKKAGVDIYSSTLFN